MNRWRKSAVFGVLLGLCACSNLAELKRAPLEGEGFAVLLASEYKAYAESEAQEYDWSDSEYFAKKGLRATRGEDVAPEELTRWKVMEENKDALAEGRANLLATLTSEVKEAYAAQAARAQLLFDCWVEQQEESWKVEETASCKMEFAQVLTQLRAEIAAAAKKAEQQAQADEGEPEEAAEPVSYTVYFDHGLSTIKEEAKEAIHSVAQTVMKLKEALVELTGYTDRSGNKRYNEKLAQLRTDAVTVALMRSGVDKEWIKAKAKGEEELAVPTADGVREEKNRRVVIEVIPGNARNEE